MIEQTLYDFLKTAVSVPVYLDIPAKPAKSFVSIQKINGGKTDKINACTVSVESVAESKFQTVELSEAVKDALEEFGESSDKVFSCKLGGESDNTDTTNKMYRYESIWNIYF